MQIAEGISALFGLAFLLLKGIGYLLVGLGNAIHFILTALTGSVRKVPPAAIAQRPSTFGPESREDRHRAQEVRREARVRQRELERLMKESARLSALEQARLEVDAFENGIDVLLSMHKESATPVDWPALAARLRPCEPTKFGESELEAKLVLAAGRGEGDAETARSIDVASHAEREDLDVRRGAWIEECSRIERQRTLARRVLNGELGAYVEAIAELSELNELKNLGSSFDVKPHDRRLVECQLIAHGREVIPNEVLSLTTSGKVSRKAMPKARLHEIYQDYVCSCALRIGREVLAVLPVDMVLVTVSVEQSDGRSTAARVIPVLSVALPRAAIRDLPFDTLDPSDTVETFIHRGDVRASGRSGEFTAIVPLGPDELTPGAGERDLDLGTLLDDARTLLHELSAIRAKASWPDSPGSSP